MLVPGAAFFNHSCDPNARASVSMSGGFLTVRTTRHIKSEEEIRIFYVSPSLPYLERKKELMDTFCFECQCSRCEIEATGKEVPLLVETHPIKPISRGGCHGLSFFLRKNAPSFFSESPSKGGGEPANVKKVPGDQASSSKPLLPVKVAKVMPLQALPVKPSLSTEKTLHEGLLESNLSVEDSLIREAGKGLFTTIAREKGNNNFMSVTNNPITL